MDDYSWIGPLVGAAAGYFGSQGGGDSTTTTNQLPSQFQPLAAGVAQRGIDIGNMPYQQYPGNRVADFSPYQFAGMDQIANQAMGPQSLLGNAQSNLSQTLNGDFLGQGNPFMQGIIDKTQGEVQGRMAGGAFNSGSFGNAGVGQATAQGLADSSNQLRFQNYNQERDRQMQGLGMAPGIAAAQYMPGQQLMGIGATMQQQGQNVLDADYQQFQNQQNWPFRTYDAMMAPFGRNLGGSTTTQGPSSNPVAGMLGGAMLGNRMQSNWGQGTTGTQNSSWAAPQWQDAGGMQGGYGWG